MKRDERCVPIHPEHLSRLPENIRRQLIFEKGYGAPFGISDKEIEEKTGGCHEVFISRNIVSK